LGVSKSILSRTRFGGLEKRETPATAIAVYISLTKASTSAKFDNLSQDQIDQFVAASLEVVDRWKKEVA